jgi:hypothetical protein
MYWVSYIQNLYYLKSLEGFIKYVYGTPLMYLIYTTYNLETITDTCDF